MMYISAYPVVITLRQSAIPAMVAQEEKNRVEAPFIQRRESAPGRVKSISESLLLRDITWIYLALLVICIAESHNIRTDPAFNIFKILFEIIRYRLYSCFHHTLE